MGESGMDFQRQALVLAMIETLRRKGSRTGKAHIIKGFFLAKAAGLLDLPFQFFLYKHGPYSMDIEETIEQMKSYGAAEVEPAFDGYGVLLSPGSNATFVERLAPLSEKAKQGIEKVCEFLCHRNASRLERLATAAWIRSQEGKDDPDQVAKRLNELKPHVSLAEARKADDDLRPFLERGRQA
jgi:uncharacterized protein YwgA